MLFWNKVVNIEELMEYIRGYIRFYNCLKEKMHWKQISFTLGINIVSAQTRFDTIRTSSMKQGRGKMKEARNVKSFLFKVAIPPILFTAKFLM